MVAEDSAASTPTKVGGKFRRKSKSRKALLGECDEWVAKCAAIEEYIAGKRSLTDDELRQHAAEAFIEAYGLEDQKKGPAKYDVHSLIYRFPPL